MRLFMKRVGQSLVPDGMEDVTDFLKLPVGKVISVDVRQSRSVSQHRLWFALCRRIGDAVGVKAEAVSDLLLIETGHYETLRTQTHGDLLRAKSIAFGVLPQAEFSDIFDRAVAVITAEWGIARADILACVQDLLIPTEVH